jgi:hypothetical protein
LRIALVLVVVLVLEIMMFHNQTTGQNSWRTMELLFLGKHRSIEDEDDDEHEDESLRILASFP